MSGPVRNQRDRLYCPEPEKSVAYPDFEWHFKDADWLDDKTNLEASTRMLRYIENRIYILDRHEWRWGARNDMERIGYLEGYRSFRCGARFTTTASCFGFRRHSSRDRRFGSSDGSGLRSLARARKPNLCASRGMEPPRQDQTSRHFHLSAVFKDDTLKMQQRLVFEIELHAEGVMSFGYCQFFQAGRTIPRQSR